MRCFEMQKAAVAQWGMWESRGLCGFPRDSGKGAGFARFPESRHFHCTYANVSMMSPVYSVNHVPGLYLVYPQLALWARRMPPASLAYSPVGHTFSPIRLYLCSSQ